MNGNRRWYRQMGSWWFFFCCFTEVLFSQPKLNIQLVTNERHPFFGAIEISGMEEGLLQKLSQITYDLQSDCKIYTDQPNADQLPMLGKLFVKDRLLYFQPRFPFIEGRTYWVVTNVTEKPILMPIFIPERTVKTPPKVIAVYPSSDQWLTNQLKFYVCFNQSMRSGEAYRHIQIEDETGKVVESPFLELERELWNPAQTRLTVWFDPGRIKQLLIPNAEKGMPLDIQRKYRLSISKEWMATNGLTLSENYLKSFKVAAADHVQPNPKNWQIKTPLSGTKDPLEIGFPEAMDYALLLSGIGVLNAQGELVAGKIELTNEEKKWYFYPAEAWKSGNYTLRISSDVEDLAGNNLERLFDSEYQESKEKSVEKFIDVEVIIH